MEVRISRLGGRYNDPTDPILPPAKPTAPTIVAKVSEEIVATVNRFLSGKSPRKRTSKRLPWERTSHRPADPASITPSREARKANARKERESARLQKQVVDPREKFLEKMGIGA